MASLTGLLSAVTAIAQDDDAYVRLRAADARLLAIAAPMMQANARLCTTTMPMADFSLHGADQYAAPPDGWFADGPVAIAAVVPGSAAEMAGLAADDAIVMIGDVAVEALPQQDGVPRRDGVFALLAAQEGPEIILTIRREGVEHQITLPAAPACRVLVEIVTADGKAARSDGKVIQIGYDLASTLTDAQLASVVAHELAHAVLAHRIRLEREGVSKGLAGQFGRNQRLNREVEVEADRMSVHLLANAGYDPQVAPQFWRSDEGRRVDGGIFRSWTYPSATGRAEILEQEIRLYLPLRRGPSWPAHLLARRDRP